jgi:hypothetical protein
LQAQQDIRKGADKRLTEARLAQSIAAVKAAKGEELSALSLDTILEGMKRDYETAAQRIDLQEQMLRDELTMATTIADRKRIQLLLLDLEEKRAALGANYTIARADQGDSRTSTTDVQAARDTLRTADQRRASGQKVINAQNRGPFGEYLASLPGSIDAVNEALERAAVNGAQKLTDQLAEAAGNMLGLHGAAGEFLNDLIKIGLQMLQVAAFGDGSAGSTGFLATAAKAAGSIFGTGGFGGGPGFAGGGQMTIGGNPGVDKNQLSLNGRPIARVGAGEVLSVHPNVAAANKSAAMPAPASPVIIAPQHYDLSGVVMTEDLVRGLRADNRAYADAVGRAAVGAAGGQVSGIIQRKQTLG